MALCDVLGILKLLNCKSIVKGLVLFDISSCYIWFPQTLFSMIAVPSFFYQSIKPLLMLPIGQALL